MNKTFSKILVITAIVLGVLNFILFAFFIVSEIVEDDEYPPIGQISAQFENFESTDNTVLVWSDTIFNFGYTELYLGDLVNDNDVGEWFIANKKIYFACVEKDENKQRHYTIYECDFYGNNLIKLYDLPAENSWDIEALGNAFYISDGEKLRVIYPLDGRQEEIIYSGDANDYVYSMRDKLGQYRQIEYNDHELIFENKSTHTVYKINAKTLNNTAEGRAVLNCKNYKFIEYSLGERLLVALLIDSNQDSASCVVFEYDEKSDKLIFQRYYVSYDYEFNLYAY